jgi:hypothetical protein
MAEVIREIVYDQGDPVLVIKAKYPRPGQEKFAIRMDDLWLYTPEKNSEFERFMMNLCGMIHDLMDLGIITTKKMAEIATVIEDGIEELLSAPPEDPNDEPGKMKRAMEDAMLRSAVGNAVKNAEIDGDKIKMVVEVTEQ